MNDLKQMIKELERSSLYSFIEHFNKEYNFMVLYFSPDDNHSYVGYRTTMDQGSRGKKIMCDIGRVYFNPAKQDLFIDSPERVVEVSESFYQTNYKASKKLDVFDCTVLPIIFPISSGIIEN